MNYRLVANQVGDLLKYDTTINEVNRAAKSVFNFQQEIFPNDSITSSRAKEFHDWVLTLAKQPLDNSLRNNLLVQFISIITPEQHEHAVDRILKSADIEVSVSNAISEDFLERNFHEVIYKHCRKLFVQENYFHAVFEAAKVYNKLVQLKALSDKDSSSLMLEVWSPNGVLKLNKCQTQTEKDVHNGIKFLSTGLMQARRNPTSHEPALDWPISKEDCLDMLSFISYLLRQLDKSTYYKAR